MNKHKIALLEKAAVLVFISLIVTLFLVDNSTKLVWTIIIPLLPLLFLIIGYSNWRNICPLAYFSKISQKLTWIKKRKVPVWFEGNFYLFQYFLLFVSFCARLLWLNFDNYYLGIFFVIVILSSFVINLVFTGKSWCNFFCPVGVVEKIYCVSNSHQYTTNSACSTCSACKKNCPDIDMESNYWKENTDAQKSFVFYSFSGLVLGFYMYFYMYAGSFELYFSGDWTHQYTSIHTDGFFFAPFVPMYIAVPLTLAFFSLLSFFFFKGIEKYLWQRQVFKNITQSTLNHRMKVIASFAAFNIFYIFAGAPSYSQYPIAYAMFYFLVVALSSMALNKEFFREESYFIQERFALKVITKWNSTKAIPSNLKEIYFTYVNATQNKKEKLRTYKETIRDLLNEGVLTTDSMILLEKLREQMAISEKEHLIVMKALEINNKELFDLNIEKSSEKRYQRSSYSKVLQDALSKNTKLEPAYIETLREQFCISDAQHKEIMSSILNADSKLHTNVMNLLKQMNALRRLHKSIFNDKSQRIIFLKYIIRNEFNIISKELFNLLSIIYDDYDKNILVLKRIFRYKNIGTKIALDRSKLAFMDEKIVDAICELKKDFNSIKNIQQTPDNRAIIKYLINIDSVHISASALLVARDYPKEYFSDLDLTKFINSDDEDIKKLVNKILNKTQDITGYEEMMYLHNIPLFNEVKFYDLKVLAKSTKVLYFKKGAYIIKQGEKGDSLFIIIGGRVEADTDGLVIDTLGYQEYFGAVALLADITRTASVKAIEDVVLLTLSKNAFKSFMRDNPSVSAKLMKSVIRRLLQDKACYFPNENTREILSK